MPASTPLSDALKTEKSAQRDKEAIQRNDAHYKDVAHASKKDESKKTAAAASGSTSEAKRGRESAAPLGKRAARRAAAAAAQKASAQPWPCDAAEARKRIRRSTRGQAIASLSQQGQVRARRRRQAATQTAVHVARSSRIGGCFFESPDGRRCRCARFCGRVCSCACAGEL